MRIFTTPGLGRGASPFRRATLSGVRAQSHASRACSSASQCPVPSSSDGSRVTVTFPVHMPSGAFHAGACAGPTVAMGRPRLVTVRDDPVLPTSSSNAKQRSLNSVTLIRRWCTAREYHCQRFYHGAPSPHLPPPMLPTVSRTSLHPPYTLPPALRHRLAALHHACVVRSANRMPVAWQSKADPRTRARASTCQHPIRRQNDQEQQHRCKSQQSSPGE